MILIKKTENRFIIFIITILLISLIGFLDYITGSEFSFSFFYLIPISLLSLYPGTKVRSVIICSVFSALLWFFAEYNSREYSNVFFPIWNGFVRLVIFNSLGLLLLHLREKDKKLKIVNEDLKKLNEEKNKFIGIAAHDMRSPIGGISSLSNIIIEEYEYTLNPKVLELLILIRTTSTNMLVLLKNLLDVSMIESGKVELKLKDQEYITFVKQQITLSQIIADRKNIKIVLESKIENIVLNYDEHYLSEVIDNLLSNAIKFSYNDSQIVINISTLNENLILTEVIDKGKGIPPEEKQKLFNYFQTSSTKPTGGEQSTGLGLAISKKIVNLHKGEIDFKSDFNKGSNFYFTLPIKR